MRRLAAFVYEGVLLFGVVMLAGFVYGVATDQRHALQGQRGLQWAVFVVLGAYFAGFWSRQGQTLAMKTWHIRLLDKAGQPVSAWRALLRYLRGTPAAGERPEVGHNPLGALSVFALLAVLVAPE